MRPDLVIFDCDGVLVDSEPPVFRVVTAELRALGLDVTLEETMATHKGKTLEQSRPLIEARLGRALPADWAAKLRQRTNAALDQALAAIPGAVAAVRAVAAAAIPHCVVSQSRRVRIDTNLRHIGLDAVFGARVYSTHDLGKPKPAPDIYLRAAANFGVAPARVAVIEDTVTGVAGGVAAGMRVLGYAADAAPGSLTAAGAAEEFTDMARVPELLRL
ncbi:MAG: HAD family phosphatase [Pseudomonadota bacterium]|nr:HAD family phosphatase [Pseudomonadota bacterium]